MACARAMGVPIGTFLYKFWTGKLISDEVLVKLLILNKVPNYVPINISLQTDMPLSRLGCAPDHAEALARVNRSIFGLFRFAGGSARCLCESLVAFLKYGNCLLLWFH